MSTTDTARCKSISLCIALIAAAAPLSGVHGDAIAAHRELPMHSPASDAADRRLPAKFGIMQTDNFVLYSDAGQDQTEQQARWAERTYQEFQRFADRCNLRPDPLRYKLVCVLFEHRDEYRDFAQSQDGMANALFTGYYSPRNDRVVFSLDSDGDRPRPQLASDDEHAPPTRSVLGFDSQGSGSSNSQHLTDSRATAAKCVHETIHQLVFHTRLMSPDVQYPLWICEGLSTAFETNDPEQPFGPDTDFVPRRDVFRSILQQGELMRLRDLVTLTQLDSQQPRVARTVYNQSYALVVWLCRNRPQALRKYLDAMLAGPRGRLTAAQHLKFFEQAFGDVDGLEAEWRASESEAASSR